MPEKTQLRRKTDFAWGACAWCSAVTKFWDFVDDRNIDQHLVAWTVLGGTYTVVNWAMRFAESHPTMDGLHMAAIIAAVLTPYTALQAAVIKWYFERGAS